MKTNDEALLAGLREMWRVADPPSAELAETMVATVAAADLDDELELLVLVHDSAHEPAAAVRGLGTARVLYFRAVQGWTLDAEIDGELIRGQLLDFDGDLTQIQVTLETKSGETWTSNLDEVGFFGMVARPTGFIRFSVRQDKVVSSSRWVEV